MQSKRSEYLVSRRRVLSAASGVGVVGVAGCLDGRSEADAAGRSAFASFFTLAEFARAVGGEEFAVENPVDPGSHGHEWEPSADLLPTVVDADAFVHLDVSGFQPWAEHVATRLDDDHEQVKLIDALDGIDLIPYDGHDDGHDHAHDDGHDHAHDDGHDHAHDDGSHGHSHGEYDAKFFTDPVLAQRGVRNVRDGLIEIDPENRNTYRRNAAAYVERLEELHELFSGRLADREHDVVVLAGHDSFQYLAKRYDFEIHTPVGLSPDHDPTPDQLARAVDLVESAGIDCVLWDYFDGPDAAELIAAEADHDVETMMVSPGESTTQQWLDAGIGSYVSQLERICLPAFERALGATDEE